MVKKCINSTEIDVVETDLPILYNASISQLIRYNAKYATVKFNKIDVNEEFLNTFDLLYNNPDQLRVFLTLVKDSDTSQWLHLLQGYENCYARNIIYTCIKDKCKEYNLKLMHYSRNIFHENVVGFEFKHPFGLTVLVSVFNSENNIRRIIRISVDSISLFDGILNSIRHFFHEHNISSKLLKKLLRYEKELLEPYRYRSPIFIDRTARLWNTDREL